MNAKIAKALRKRAAQETVGQPAVNYLQKKATREIIVDPQSTKGRYKLLKKAYKMAYAGDHART